MPNSNFGIPQTPTSASASFLDASMSQPNASRPQAMNNPLRTRELGFLNGIASVFAKRGTPLPPALTGVPSPLYDPNHSPWSTIEVGSDIGFFKLAGKEVNLFKLWGLVFQHGGGQSVSQARAWPNLLPLLELPEEYIHPQKNVPTSVAHVLCNYYMTILHPFEVVYKKNIQDQQKKAQMSQGQGPMADQQFPTSSNLARSNTGMPNIQQPSMRPMSSNGLMSGSSSLGQFPQIGSQHRPTAGPNPHQTSATDPHSAIIPSDIDPFTHTVDSNLLDQDVQGIKRKLDHDDRDTKRARQKTDPPESNSMLLDGGLANQSVSQPSASLSAGTRPRQQLSRRKIEYVPYARELDSYGGRDLPAVNEEYMYSSKRPLREIHDWGTVDIDCLCMSIRSRLSIELSYALTTLTVFSTMRAQNPGSGFPIHQCPDLLDDCLDLVEELAFGEPEKGPEPNFTDKIFTNRALIALVEDIQSQPFAALETPQGTKDPSLGPQQRPANHILCIVNIIRNLSTLSDNTEFFANHPRLVNIFLRLCTVEQADGKPPLPVAKVLSLSDVLMVRRDTLYILTSLAGSINLSVNSTSLTTLRLARRTFELLSSYLIDPEDSLPPLASVQLAGVVPTPGLKPPVLVDVALEVFTRFSQSDNNRQVLSKIIPQPMLWLLLRSLVHRLPITDSDFLLMHRELWSSFVEKTVMAIYSLVFLSPYELKQKIKNDRRLAFKNVLLRVAQKVLAVMPNPDGRGLYVIPVRRAVEAIKLLDKAEELVDKSEPTMPVLSFGMGFSDGGDSGMEKGTGMLGGNRDVAWDMFMLRDVFQDDVLFNELDSLVRIECQ